MAKLLVMIAMYASTALADPCLQEMEKRYNSQKTKLESKQIKPVNLSSDGLTLRLNGEITPGMGRLFAALTSAQKSKIQFLILNSPGGKVVHAAPIADWVFEKHLGLK